MMVMEVRTRAGGIGRIHDDSCSGKTQQDIDRIDGECGNAIARIYEEAEKATCTA